MFEVIPAIDLYEGKCVRLFQGHYDAKTIYSDNPVEIAIKWQKKGATRIHIVDLEGARDGAPKNIEIVKEIISNVSIPIQIGGGIRDEETIAKLIDLGINRVIIGTTAIKDPEITKTILNKYKGRIIISIDVKDGKVAVNGWEKISSVDPQIFIQEAVSYGAKRFIYTDILRDGTLIGPNLETIKTIATRIEVPLIVAGGISKKEDVQAVRELNKFGVEGCIIGRALYTGDIKLEDVI